MRLNKIKYWKVIKSNLKLHDALNILRTQSIEENDMGVHYDYLAIRLGYKLILPNTKVDELLFSIMEMENENWEAIIPDDGKEKLLYKVREMVKNENFLRASHEEINNMSIFDIWNAIDDVVSMLDENAQYRLIKHIIENKLYKKS